MSSKVLVIIVTYNGMQWLKRSLDSVTHTLDVYVVDNGSSDGSVEFIAQNYPSVILHESGENLGFGAANNIGMQYAIERGYDYIYLLNQDGWVTPDTISTMVDAQRQNPEYGVLSPMQMNPDWESLEPSFGRIYKRSLKGGAKDLESTSILRTKTTMAAHWLISRECLLKVGLFSPVFYHYGEDNNYIHRAKYFKFKNGVCTTAKAVHDKGVRPATLEKSIYLVQNSFLKYSSDINYPYIIMILFAYLSLLKYSIRLARKHKDSSIIGRVFSKSFDLAQIRQDRARNKRVYYSL